VFTLIGVFAQVAAFGEAAAAAVNEPVLPTLWRYLILDLMQQNIRSHSVLYIIQTCAQLVLAHGIIFCQELMFIFLAASWYGDLGGVYMCARVCCVPWGWRLGACNALLCSPL